MDKINKTLIKIGAPTHMKGFYYLHDAIELCLADARYKNETISTYNEVAKMHGEKPANIERCIRNAILHCFNYGNKEELFNIFGSTKRLKNSQFITMLALHIQG